MQVTFFSSKSYDEEFFAAENKVKEHALTQIARTTLQNLTDLEQTGSCANEVKMVS